MTMLRGMMIAAAVPMALAGCMASAGMNGDMGMSARNRQADMDAHAFASAVDATEVQQGMLAQQKAANASVRTFANQMVTEHSNALRMRESQMTQLGMGMGMRGDGWTRESSMAYGSGSMNANGAMNTSTTSGSVGSGSMNGGASESMMMTPSGMSGLETALMANAASRPVIEAAPATLQHLRSLNGVAFDRAYLDTQVTAHQTALETLDRMINSATLSPDVLETMRSMRAAVANHLQMATQLRGRR